MSEKNLNRGLAAGIFLAALTVYMLTMAVTVSFWDSGEFVATSYILGIPHSPGTPLYVLVGRVFCLFPLAMSAAQKVNLLSTVSAALGVLMAYLVMVMVIRFMFGQVKSTVERFARHVGPLVGSCFLIFSDTYWTNASEAEVYALSTFVMGFCTVLALRWLEGHERAFDPAAKKETVRGAGRGAGESTAAQSEIRRHSSNLILLIVYLLSLGIGFHLGTVMVYGGIFLMLLLVREKVFSNFELLVFTFGFAVMVADMTVHKQSELTLVLLGIFALLLLWTTMSKGRFALYASALFVLGISVHLFLLIRSHMDPRLDMVDPQTWRALYAHLRREQYPPLNMMIRKAPIAFQFGQFWRYFCSQFRMFGDVGVGSFNIGLATVVIPTMLGLYGIYANYLRERRSWILNFTNLAINTVGMIILLNFSDHEPRERDYFYGPGFYFFTLFIGIGASSFLMLLCEQGKQGGRDLKRFVVPAGILLLVFSILPARHGWFTHDRSDNYLARDYAYNMLASLEPDAILITNGDNDTYPMWYIQNVEGFRPDVQVVNRMLLNTSWYVKQIRDQDPPVPMDLDDQEIDRLRPIRNPRDGSVIWMYARVLDQIVRATNWKRPIYFGVTVPPEVWQIYSEHLEMQGMVRRLVTRKGKFMVNDFMIERNLSHIFRWEGILTDEGLHDGSLYKSPDVVTMYQNYSVAAMQLSMNNGYRQNFSDAIRWGEFAYEVSPEFQWGRKELGVFYMRGGHMKEALAYFRKNAARDPGNCDFHLGIAGAYESMNDLESALEALEIASKAVPDCRDVYTHGFHIAGTLGKMDKARDFIKRWVDGHPADKEMTALFSDIDRVLLEQFDGRTPADSGVGR